MVDSINLYFVLCDALNQKYFSSCHCFFQKNFYFFQVPQLLSNNLLLFLPQLVFFFSKKFLQLFSLFPSVPFLFNSPTINLSAAKRLLSWKPPLEIFFKTTFIIFHLPNNLGVFLIVSLKMLSWAKIQSKQQNCQNKPLHFLQNPTPNFFAKSFSPDCKCAIYFFRLRLELKIKSLN